MHLVIVESPTKAKTIRKFLGRDYTILASMGHVRDLPQSAEEIPESVKKEPWANLGVDVDHGFEPLYIIPKNKAETIRELKHALKDAEDVYLATDEDREGESISWHLLQLLKPKVPVHRMVFHEITERAIHAALEHPRDLDENLVHAQETRRVLDRLVGYTVSPLLWKKIAYGLSAGRVQSVALKALIERERTRMGFLTAGYFDVLAQLTHQDIAFPATLVSTDGKRLAQGKDFDGTTGRLREDTKDIVALNETEATAIANEVATSSWKVTDATEKPVSRKPVPPFITSTFQQEANRKLGLSSRDSMRVAQALYEHGHITYMRTDSTNLSDEAIQAVRREATQRFGAEFVPDKPRQYTTTSKGAQEAHEAIRPSLLFTAPQDMNLSGSERAVYELIWMRTMASQMKDSQEQHVSVTLQSGKHVFTSSGRKILFAGFLRAYAEGSDDPNEDLAEQERILPSLAIGDAPHCTKTESQGHATKPPSRFTEAGLIQWMEKEGIGRPSTYASIISTLIDRGYVTKAQNTLLPTFRGLAVIQLLEKHVPDLVDSSFTSKMEARLDDIAEGKEAWQPYLSAFYLGSKGLRERINEKSKEIPPDEARTINLPQVPSITVRVGRFGPYFETKTEGTPLKASLPETLAPADLTTESLGELMKQAERGPTSLGQDPETAAWVYIRTGSYGAYLQLGEDSEDKKQKPKRISIPKDFDLATLDLPRALALLSLPRTLGVHPASGKDVKAGLGRFGPYIVCDGDFRSLKGEDNVLTVTLERALELLAQPKLGRGRSAPLKTLGTHPDDQKPITLHQGKFGAYVKHGEKNATLPKDMTIETITLEQAIQVLNAKKTTSTKKIPAKRKRAAKKKETV